MEVVIQVDRVRRLCDGRNLRLFVVLVARETSKPQGRERVGYRTNLLHTNEN